MSVQISCAECGRGYTLADSMLGKKVRCKNCGEIIDVVNTGLTAEPPPASARKSPPKPLPPVREARPESRRSTRRDDEREYDDDRPIKSTGVPKWVWAVAGVGGLAVVGLVVALTILFTRPEPQQVAVAQIDPGVPAPVPQMQPVPIVPPPLQPKPPAVRPAVRPPVIAPPVQQPEVVPVIKPPTKPIAPIIKPADNPVIMPGGPDPVVRPPFPGRGGPVVEVVQNQNGWNWAVKEDPGPEIYTTAVKPKTTPLNGLQESVFPSTPSEYVALRSGQSWTSIHIPTFKTAGSIQGKLELTGPALSPDGKFIAGIQQKTLLVMSLADAKLIRTLSPWPETNWCDFLPDGQLITGVRTLFDTKFQIWNKDGVEEAKILLKGHLEPRRHVLSPGRHYMIASAGDTRNGGIPVFETATGKEVGRLPGGAVPCQGVAFSNDGKDIAVYYEEGDRAEIATFKAETGERIAEIKFAKNPASQIDGASTHFNPRPSIMFTPDKTCLLIHGEVLVTNPGGAMIYKIPTGGTFDKTRRRWAGPDHMVLVDNASLTIAPMLRTEVAALIKKAAAADELRNQLEFPEPKTADHSAAVKLADPAQPAPWSGAVQAMAAGDKARTSSPIKLRFGADKTIDLALAGASSAQVVAIVRDQIDPLAGKDLIQADRYDMAAGRLLDTVPLFPAEGAKGRGGVFAALRGDASDGIKLDTAVSPDGQTLAIRRAAEPNRIDLWNLKEAKHIGAFTPHHNEPIDHFVPMDGNRLWTTGGSNLILWQIPEFKAIATGSGYKGKIVVSPNQKYLVVSSGRRLELLDATDGKRDGSLADYPVAESIVSGFFPPGGTQFIAAVTNGQETALVNWDLSKGTIHAAMPVERLSDQKNKLLAHAGPNHVFFDGNLYAWSFATSPLMSFPPLARTTNVASDGAFRILSPGGQSKDALVSANLLTQNVALLTTRLPGAEKLTPPGSSFKLTVTGGPESYQDAAKKTFRAEVEKLGHVMGDGGFEVFVQAEMRDTGKVGRYLTRPVGPPFGPGGPRGPFGKFFDDEPKGYPKGHPKNAASGGQPIDIRIQALTVTMRVVNPAGVEVFKNQSFRTTPDEFTQRTNNPEQELIEMMWATAGVPTIAPLARRYRIDGQTYDLPTPAQWGF